VQRRRAKKLSTQKPGSSPGFSSPEFNLPEPEDYPHLQLWHRAAPHTHADGLRLMVLVVQLFMRRIAPWPVAPVCTTRTSVVNSHVHPNPIHMKHLSAFLLFSLAVGAANAQTYCQPTFINGCSGWRNIAITAGTLSWGDDIDCSFGDHADMSTTVEAGDDIAMTVENGAWCGCAVWVDLDNNSTFEETENLYTLYVGGTPSYTYAFSISIPEGTAPGAHRMRVIAPWGSDGVTVGENGYGPCGDYQYGNYDDFMINVTGSTIGMDEYGMAATRLSASPNPTNGLVTISTDDATPLEQIAIRSADGRLVQQEVFTARTTTARVDLEKLPAGIYFVQSASKTGMRTVQVAKN